MPSSSHIEMDTELITYEAVRRDPDLLRALINKAHRERAETRCTG